MLNAGESSSQEGPTYEDIVNAQNQYYETHKKNTFFKKSQKFDCAESVCSQIPLEHLINQTCWIVPNENKVVFDYRPFKMYANPSNYIIIVDNIVRSVPGVFLNMADSSFISTWIRFPFRVPNDTATL